MTMKPAVVLAIVAALLLLSPLAQSADLEGFDEPEPAVARGEAPIPDAYAYETLDPINAAAPESSPGTTAAADSSSGAAPATDAHAQGEKLERPTPPARELKLSNFVLEAVAASLILVYVIIIFRGMRVNNSIGEAWARAFACPGGIFDRNFSYRGPKDTGVVLMRESAHVFKFYASGRRYCQGLLAELQLLARQDAISMLWQLLSPAEDLLKIEVFMHEASMPPIVLAVATARCARAMQNGLSDISRFTKRISVAKEVLPGWPADKLWVLAEHSSVFADLFADQKVQQLFSTSGPHAASMKLFRSLHFTSENSEGSHKQVLRFSFKLPPVGQMDALARLMELVPHFIDVVGTYKMSPDLRKRAIDARTKQADADEELRRKRLEAVQQKKLEKAQEERAKVLRMTPEARQKHEEKMQRQQQKKAMKSKVVRM